MIRSPRSAFLTGMLLVAIFAASACDAPDAGTAPSAGSSASAAVAPAATPAATPAPAATTAAASAAAPAPPPATTAAGKGIDDCCAAIVAIKSSGRDSIAKGKAASAAGVCPGIATAVKEGKTSRADGLTQIKSLLQGITIPTECN